ncbi:lysozyme inhibitor LprI family protein [Erwinia sp. MMLR14_017]|uniref:lysozyme inhibitor LprI family protein n=1 Tax=Erwinia sp. MMLR14_017 TaxID=3093842 RepID=UPI00298F9101|nr:lysozyme inhibitor LprI family protein [Erwinia sp. MMLR14_017]MDW8844505.1 lysozyme inhibitor LprI family protein [Erwinia sp. MMLR14_017]
MKKIALVLTVLLFMLNAQAATNPIDTAQQTCLNRAATTLAMQRCFAEANTAWDKEMNQQYARLIAILSTEQQAKLRGAQRAWLEYRDSWLEAVKARLSDSGTQASLQTGAQQVDLVKNQALALKSLAQSCGNPDECH